MTVSSADVTRRAQSILIVDDEPHNQRLLDTILAPEGYEVQFASSGDDALTMISRDAPDLILLDVMMPGMNGFEVTTRLKANISTRNIPVILVSALDDRTSRIRGLNAGAEDFVVKPVDHSELSVRVRNLLRLKDFGDFHDKYGRELERQVVMRTDELLLERDRAQRYLDTAAVILLALDAGGNITMLNRHGSAVLGWESSELIGRNWFDVCVPQRNREAQRATFGQLLAGDILTRSYLICARSGDERLIEWRNAIVQNEAGVVTGAFKSGTDVTDQARTATALQQSEERMRFAFENADIGMWDMDCATQGVRLSSILQRQYGIAPGTFVGTFEAFVAGLHPDDRQAMIAGIDAAMRSGEDFSVTHRTIAADKRVRTHVGTGRFVLDADGVAVRGVGISQDVTDARAMERQNQQAQKMDAVGRLASGVAHDFNNLLCVVLGWTGLALADLPPEDPIREALNEVMKAGESASRLTKQLLSFSRQHVVEAVLFNPNEVVAAAELMLRPLIGEQIELVTEVSADLGSVQMDRGQLDQVLMNLVVNARDAMPDGGRLTLRTSNQEVDERAAALLGDVASGEYVTLSVTDTGTGMSDDVMARIFEPFFTTKAEDKGTGLGLATSYGIVHASGGRIQVRSEVGMGTTMKIYLPRASGRRSGAVRQPRLTPVPGVERVLVIEDELPVRRVIARMLEELGYRVFNAGGAVEALAVMADVGPSVQLALIDVVLAGGVSGTAIANQLLELFPNIKIMFMSGYTKDRSLLRGKDDMDFPLLQKPFTASVLGAKLRTVLDGL